MNHYVQHLPPQNNYSVDTYRNDNVIIASKLRWPNVLRTLCVLCINVGLEVCVYGYNLVENSSLTRDWSMTNLQYSDVIINAMASQIAGVSIVCSPVCSGTDQRNIKAPSHWPLWGNPPVTATKGQLRGNVSIWWHNHEIETIPNGGLQIE